MISMSITPTSMNVMVLQSVFGLLKITFVFMQTRLATNSIQRLMSMQICVIWSMMEPTR